MGRAHCLVSPELRARLYDEAALKGSLFVLDDKPFGDGTHLLHVVSDRLPRPGYNGSMDIVIEGGMLRFKKDADV
jgi:hypothetical protein